MIPYILIMVYHMSAALEVWNFSYQGNYITMIYALKPKELRIVTKL